MGDGVEHVDNVKEKHGMGRGCQYLQRVGKRCRIQAFLGEVNDSFNTTMDADAKLSAGEEV
jgi:hypothetical protein